MSAFGYYEKDAVVDAIETLALSEKGRSMTTRQIVESILEATTYAINTVLYNELENHH